MSGSKETLPNDLLQQIQSDLQDVNKMLYEHKSELAELTAEMSNASQRQHSQTVPEHRK